jgi:triacylglycerol lipase
MINADDSEQRNSHPLVLVYGFMGYEIESFVSFPYWGGLVDLRSELEKSGIATYTPEIGPVSSNWDRACELYAALKGGRVDYGAAHARTYGHARYGRRYSGLLPEWGQTDPETGDIRKVHLLGHSMGGQTARLLVHLLTYGAPEECAAAAGECSPLFLGGSPAVASVTSISTPHNGTTMTAGYDEVGGFKKLFARLLASWSVGRPDPIIDLMLDHWTPVAEAADMTLAGYIQMLLQEDRWKDVEDSAFYDLSPRGSAALNRRVKATSEVYYFSWGTSRTVSEGPAGEHIPAEGMHLSLHARARFMGSLRELPPGAEGPPERWWENDGVVNTCSMHGPTAGSNEKIRGYDGIALPGCWNSMGVLFPLDHWQVHVRMLVGDDTPPGCESLVDFYERMGRFLRSLGKEE